MKLLGFVSWGDTPTAVGAVAGTVALLLSLYNFWEARRARSRAAIGVRWEVYALPGPEARTGFERLVVVNHGPSIATNVDLALATFRPNYTPTSEPEPRPANDVLLDKDVYPIPELHPGDEVHAHYASSFAESLWSARLLWDDGRHGRQSKTVRLTMQRVI